MQQLSFLNKWSVLLPDEFEQKSIHPFMTDCGTSNAKAVYTKCDNPSALDNIFFLLVTDLSLTMNLFCLIFLIIGVHSIISLLLILTDLNT